MTSRKDSSVDSDQQNAPAREFRAYRYEQIWAYLPCECGEKDCGDAEAVNVTEQVRAMENELARYEGRTVVA